MEILFTFENPRQKRKQTQLALENISLIPPWT